MKHLMLLAFAIFAFASCNQNNEIVSSKDLSITGRAPGVKVDLCHYSEEDGTWHVISVNSNALQAHLNHGDVLLVDSDEDGYVSAENECVPGGDCDDDDPAVNPGASEVCDNEVDEDCDGEATTCDLCGTVDACCFCPALEELNLTCWNGDVNNPILWDANPFYGLCSNCLPSGGNCGYRTPSSGVDVNSGSPASAECRQYLLDLVVELNLGIGTNCGGAAAPGGGSNSNSSQAGSGVFGQ